jgi:osmotically-inducible protein OsmY
MIKKFFFAVILISTNTLLAGCLGTIWTGATLIYERHTTYKKIKDFHLSAQASKSLYRDAEFKCSLCLVDIAVFNQDILLSGHVPTEKLRAEAVQRIVSLKDVRRIFNQLSVKDTTSDTVEDSLITGMIRSRIIADATINPNQFKIVTSDHIVYLMGDVDPAQAKKVIQIAREVPGVLRVVKLFKYYLLVDQPA